jgi:hypothetical protein
MFYNRISTNNEVNSKVHFVGSHEEYFHSTYNNIISKIELAYQYENYYIVNTDMLYYKIDSEQVNQLDALTEVVNNVITDDIISKIKHGNGLLIFDFGCEIIPISTDDTTLYGKINKFFYDKDCAQGVQYWTMFETPFELVDKSECYVDIISVSLSTLRYTDFDYVNYKNLLTDTSIEPKSMMYLNRQARENRIKLLAECIRNNVDLDDSYFSFLCNSLNKNGGQDGKTFFGDDDIELIEHVITQAPAWCSWERWGNWDGEFPEWKEMDNKNKIRNNNIFKTIMNDHYGKGIFLTKKNRNDWLGDSDAGRVVELLNHRAKSKFEVIAEFSYADKGVMISEKLSLSILSKIPFVVLGNKGYMNHLKELGFKTFDNFWDETYDTKNNDDRIIELTKTILDIQQNFKCDIDEYGNYVYTDEMNAILKHNYNYYKNVYTPMLQNRILKAISKSEKLHFRYETSDKIWYNDTTCTVVVSIPGNGMEYFNDRMAKSLNYKLMNRADVPELSKLPAIVIIRNPFQRLDEQLWETGMTFDGFIEAYRDTDYMKTQVSFIKGLSVWEIIDLDDILNDTSHKKSNFSANYEHIKSDNFGRTFGSTEEDRNDKRLCDWHNDIINYIKIGNRGPHCKGGYQWYTDYCSTYKNSDERFTSEQKEKIHELFKSDFEFYNDSKKREKTFLSNYNWINDELTNYMDTLKSRTDITDCINEMIEHGETFKEQLDEVAWQDHMHILKSIGIQNMSKDISILDMGTQFGIIPHFLSSVGFTDVSCTNSSKEASKGIVDLNLIWDKFDLSVIDLHINPQKEFTLSKKYDVIVATRTNILFKTKEIFKFTDGRFLDKTNFSDSRNDMFFVPYNSSELEYFIVNIKKVLNPGGIAIIQPYPFVYHTRGYKKQLKLLSKYQTKGHVSISSGESNINLVHDYFVIRN